MLAFLFLDGGYEAVPLALSDSSGLSDLSFFNDVFGWSAWILVLLVRYETSRFLFLPLLSWLH